MKTIKKYPVLCMLFRLIVFTFVFVFAFLSLDKFFFSERKLHPVWKYVSSKVYEPIDVLFVGNSHTYTSIDAELLSRATGLNIRSLTCSSINGGIVAADLEAFLNYEIPSVVVVELCPFTADNYAMMKTKKLGIVFEHFDSIPTRLIRWKAVSQVANFEDTPSGVFQLLRSTMMWTRWSFDNESRTTYDAYGTDRKYKVSYAAGFDPQAKEQAYSQARSKETTTLVPENLIALDRIIELAEQYHISLWFYNAPIQYFDQRFVNLLYHISSLQETHPCICYIDNSMLYLSEIGLSKTDFYDKEHLNPNGMEKTSVWMGKQISDRLQTEFQTDSVHLYKSTSVSMTDSGTYRYVFDTFCKGQYRFVYTLNGEKHDTGYIDENWVEESAIPPKEIEKFTVCTRPSEEAADKKDSVWYEFLPYTIEEYSVKIEDTSINCINKSDFADDLFFAWEIIDLVANRTVKYDYSSSPELTHTFTENGTYMIRALTMQLSNSVCRETGIMTIAVDAENNAVLIEKTSDLVVLE